MPRKYSLDTTNPALRQSDPTKTIYGLVMRDGVLVTTCNKAE